MSDSATPGTIALQAPLSVGFSRQEYWSGLPFPSLGDLPDPVIQPLPWVGVPSSLSPASKAEEENCAICALARILLAPSALYFSYSSSVCSEHCTPVSQSFKQDLYLHHNLSSQASCGPEVTLAFPPTTGPPAQSPSFSAPPRTCFLFPPAIGLPTLHKSQYCTLLPTPWPPSLLLLAPLPWPPTFFSCFLSPSPFFTGLSDLLKL